MEKKWTFRNSFGVMITLLFILVSCISKKQCPDGELGVIKNLNGLDGCGWVIELKNGDKLQPLNFDSFTEVQKKEGLLVHLSYKTMDGMGSICMVGKIVELNCLVTQE